MEYHSTEDLQNKIEAALKISGEKLLETKKKNQQQIAISIDGKIQIITPK